MADNFVNWDDLDLYYFLGEDNWTDAEQDDLLGSEQEWQAAKMRVSMMFKLSSSIRSGPGGRASSGTGKTDNRDKENDNTSIKTTPNAV